MPSQKPEHQGRYPKGYLVNMVENITKRLNLRKDKGYAWCILVMSFLSHVVHTGFSFGILGNLTLAHKELFKLEVQQSALIGSVETGLFLMLAPLASVMLKKTNCRVTELVGGVSLILGVGLSSLTTQPWHAYLLYGVVAAWGFSCCYVAASSILSLHFDKYKYLAFALAVLGYYVGMVAWPMVSQKLFNAYGYNKAMGIMASFHILHIIAALLFFEPLKENTTEKDNAEASTKNNNQTEKGNKEEQGAEGSKKTVDGKPPSTLLESFKVLLTSPKVWSYVANSFLWCFNVTSFLILVNAYIVKKLEISKDEAALGITILGIANLVGNGIVVAVSRQRFNRVLLHISCSVIFGICTIIISFSVNKAMFYALTASWGLGKGMHLSNRLAVVSEIAGADRLPLLFGIGLFGEGIGSLVAAPLCNYVELKHGALYGLILSGICGIAAGIVMLPVVIYNYRYETATAAIASTSNGNSEAQKQAQQGEDRV